MLTQSPEKKFMNGAKYGKGDRPRNNWGRKWYTGYEGICWSRPLEAAAGHAMAKMDSAAEMPGVTKGRLVRG